MSVDKTIGEWKQGLFKPVYWLEGEEEFFIDNAVDYAEHHILNDADAQFNLTVFYGRDANWSDVTNACRRYPMFAERQVVLLKEAQHMKDIDKLESYVANPLPSTVFVIAYKGKTVDKRGKLAKTLKDHAEMILSKKLYENNLPEWGAAYVASKGYKIDAKALGLLVDHIGNDLSRIAGEIDKLMMNIPAGGNITVEDIQKYVGISKDYNIYELQKALAFKDITRAIMIVQYLDSNPKAIPVQLLLPTLYNFFSKLLLVHQMPNKTEHSVKHLFYNNLSSAKEAVHATKLYSYQGVEKVMLLLHHYNLKSIGVGNVSVSPGSLMKEMVMKILTAE